MTPPCHYRRLWAADFEFTAPPGERPVPLCLVAKELLGEHARAADLFDAAKSADPRAADWLRELQEYLAMSVADVIALLDPQAVIFGGGVTMAQGEAFIAPIRNMALRSVPFGANVLLSTLGEDAQLLGAIKLAIDRLNPEGAAK